MHNVVTAFWIVVYLKYNKYVSGDWPLFTHANPTRGHHAGRISQCTGHSRRPVNDISTLCLLAYMDNKLCI